MDGKARAQSGGPDATRLTARLAGRLARLRAAETQRLALWTPGAIGLGVGLAFAQDASPGPGGLLAAAALALLGALGSRLLARSGGGARAVLRVTLAALALAAIGFLAAERRIATVEAPVWPEDLRGERGVSGRMIGLARSGSGALRVRLDRLEIEGVAARDAPARIDITLREKPMAQGDPGAAPLDLALLGKVGRRVGLRARLFPPPSAAEPGAFDYRFRAYFQRLGALGVQGDGDAAALRDLGPAGVSGAFDGLAARVAALRAYLASRIRSAAPGVEGAVIAALLVGDRSGLPETTLEALRDANLAHLLAISGLHMAMVCLTVFAALRLALALPARPVLGLSAKKAAAFGAILAGLFYLQISGGGPPPERAFTMVAVAFGAVLVDRPAVTLRAVALAATLLLLLRPESLYEPGFQLSFAATTAMVAVFEASRPVWRRRRRLGALRAVLLWAGALVVSSATAGLATAPFAALTFNRLSRYGLIANLAAAPAMGLWIMPLGVTALALTPLGLDGPIYSLMAVGVSYVLAVAETVASWDGARIPTRAAPPLVGALLALAGLTLSLWRSAALKALGLAPLLAALVIWRSAERPELLIARSGRLLGVLTAEGRAFDRDPRRAQSYSAELWLRRDGDGADLDQAAARRAFRGRRGERAAEMTGGWRLLRFADRGLSRTDLASHCAPKTLLVAPRSRLFQPAAAAPWREMSEGCLLIDAGALERHGAIAVEAPGASGEPPRWRSVGAEEAKRPWSRAPEPDLKEEQSLKERADEIQ